MVFDILTLFPEMFTGPFSASILKRAVDRGIIRINLINIRDYSPNRHRTVDDAPFGGGAGMVMGPEPIIRALEAVQQKRESKTGPVILLCPQGERFTQALARELSREEHLVLICGHYEGVDERVRGYVTGEISIGDYVLTGGELAAMVVVDAVSRHVPGVLGEETAPATDSFADGLLEHPQYTRPRSFQGSEVPEVLLSGHHARIARWRREEALIRTLVRRPELLETARLDAADRQFLRELAARLSRMNLNG
ncbi:MAG: tRNA (guanosine(37)-N1)-methyltransferase TrmD [Thermoanaerobacteraceae bacterium]|nr:tRNA (guanosine(37)-N1)-methyltransferase TrmD [Thermoanaerobacteraceae bacterium]